MHEHERINKFSSLIRSLYETAKDKLGFEPHAKIVIVKSDENMENPLGKTAHYSPAEHKIGLYTQGRHIKDILRSLSHELVHHNQNCRGDFDNGAATVQGYAQEDGHLREMEREAYECGNMIFRDWEDKLKEKGGKPLFTSTHYANAIMEKGEKLMENQLKESRLRNIIRGVIQEMFNEDLNEEEDLGIDEKGEAEEEMAEAGVAAATAGKAPYEVGGEELEEAKEETLEEEKEELAEQDTEELKETQDEALEGEEEINETFFPKTRSIREKARFQTNEALMKQWGYFKKEK